MFVTKKRFEATVRRLQVDLQFAELENSELENDVEYFLAKVKTLETALTEIAANRTTGANATVTRMANIADKALGRTTPKATFISEEPKPEGTLAQIRTQLLTKDEGRILASSDQINLTPVFLTGTLDLDDDYGHTIVTASPSVSDTTSFGGFGGGSFDGGGASGSWSSSDSCSSSSSSSYDSGSSSSYDSGSSCSGGGDY